MKLVWAQYVLDDRDAIFRYIEKENPRAAAHVDERLFVVRAVFLSFLKVDVPAG